jgi:RNA polymerase sigma-70 factor, ECF subfamily
MARRDEGLSTPETDWPLASMPGDGRRGVESLLGQVARGDPDAFAALYDQVAGTVYGLVRRMAGDPARAQDVTGDVLTEVWHTASGFRAAEGSGMSWIMAIARRRTVAQVRATREAPRRPKRSQAAQVVQQVAGQAGLSLTGPSGAPGADRLAALPEPQRQALILVLYGGYTQGQVASLLGVRSGTVAAWLRDGLPRLR